MQQDDEGFQINFLKRQLQASMARNNLIEKQNQELSNEIARLKAWLISLRAHNNEMKSMLWKNLQPRNSFDTTLIDASPEKKSEEQSLAMVKLKQSPTQDHLQLAAKRETSRSFETRGVPDLVTSPSFKEAMRNKSPPATPPPPPPPPSTSLIGSKAVRRVPEVVELYRSLTRRDVHMESKINPSGFCLPAVAFTNNMIGEIENRSAYLSSIKSDVETRGEFIKFLIKEIENAAFTDISMVEAFVKWLDEELSSLVDERAVLKQFPQWPERKADAMREAAFSYRDLKNLEIEVLSFEDSPKESYNQFLRKAQSLQDRLEQSINDVQRISESTSKKYRKFQIPWEWMTDNGLIGQMKLSSLRLANEYMKRIAKEIKLNECSRDENPLLQAVRFAYRVHQFAGGFDAETILAFKELRKVGMAGHEHI